MAFLGGVFCPYPCWSMSTIPPYKTTQVVVNMDHSDVKCKIITQSGNHQQKTILNHYEPMKFIEVHHVFHQISPISGVPWAPKRAPLSAPLAPRCRVQHLWRIQRLARHRALRELHRAERGGCARSCQRFLPAPGPGGLRRLDQRWGAAGLGQAGLLNMAILMAIESQSWKKTWLKHLGVRSWCFFGMIFTSFAEVLVGNSWITTCNMKTPWKLGIWL